MIATQNPIEYYGTYPLPEAQLDRFLIRLSLGYPTDDGAVAMMRRFISESPLETLEPVAAREEIAQAELRGDTIPKSMTKADYAEYRFESALAEEDDFDMLVMGRTQGKGCYCYVNGVLKTLLDKYIGAYRYVVIDNEAGMEHIARGTLPHVDALLLVSDCSRRGVQAVARIAEMVRELDLKPGLMKLIINRAPGGVLSDGVREEIEAHHLELAGVLPQDDAVYEADCDGKPSSKIPDASPVKRALHGIMQDLSL